MTILFSNCYIFFIFQDGLISICEAPLSTLTQSILPSQISTQQSESQPIGEDILALCTGKFYDNEFISEPFQDYTQSQGTTYCDSQNLSPIKLDNLKEPHVSFNNNTASNIDISKNVHTTDNHDVQSINNSKDVKRLDTLKNTENDNKLCEVDQPNAIDKDKPITEDSSILKSILDELQDPEFDSPKPNKYFVGNTKFDNPLKKKFVIDSDDDDTRQESASCENKKKKKIKKRKPEKRALQISGNIMFFCYSYIIEK